MAKIWMEDTKSYKEVLFIIFKINDLFIVIYITNICKGIKSYVSIRHG